ncbi:hypothetical protein U91I_03247 [alpha proteobacterium U9-1i]|nr:hypothetical protein U91I_03247 [alpha proteobacterium U9-1i]
MRELLATLGAVLALAMASPASAQASAGGPGRAGDCALPYEALCHEILLPAPVAEVWPLFSTSAGLSSWMAPVAAIDLRVGGMMEASYSRGARPGDAGNILNRVLSYLPERMISIAIERAPPNFPHADEARTLWTVIELEPYAENVTRVRVIMLGYDEGEAFDVLARHFNAGNTWTLEKLYERVANGPENWASLGGGQ